MDNSKNIFSLINKKIMDTKKEGTSDVQAENQRRLNYCYSSFLSNDEQNDFTLLGANFNGFIKAVMDNSQRLSQRILEDIKKDKQEVPSSSLKNLKIKDLLEKPLCNECTSAPDHQLLLDMGTSQQKQPTTSKGSKPKFSDFCTALEPLSDGDSALPQMCGFKRKFGLDRMVNKKFISPLYTYNQTEKQVGETQQPMNEKLKNIDPNMIKMIENEIILIRNEATWDEISGLDFAKTTIQEAVVWPMLRPDLFTGLRRPPKAILLFGPPGTGKTLIGRCVASQSGATFFSISASTLTSKWIGDGEKMVRALFAVAECRQPSVVFIDEVDALLSKRSDTEHEATRRLKTEFLVRLDGTTTDAADRVLVIGATNRPQEIDEAARRRFVKRLYIPLPDEKARRHLVHTLVSREQNTLKDEDIDLIAQKIDGYSGADVRSLCTEASMGPIRSIGIRSIHDFNIDALRPISIDDFYSAMERVKPSVCGEDLKNYELWDEAYGSGNRK